MSTFDEPDFNEPIRAERQTVRFFDGLEVDGYRMPNGEFRIGLSGTSRVLGYADRWLGDSVGGESPRTAKALQGIGFSTNTQKVLSQSKQGNDYLDTTITLDDFNCCIIYAIGAKKKAAIALQKSFTKMALNDFFRDAFGEPPLSIDQKRQLFYETYAATISPEDWRRMDKQDILRLALPGDEPHLKKGRWNCWSDDD
jgi:hypothetical protein